MIKLRSLLLESHKFWEIYSDMDGVIANFEKGFHDLTGMSCSDFTKKYGDDEFWKKIDEKGIHFWASLKPMPNKDEYWSFLNSLNIPVSLLTAPSKQEDSRIGKLVWVKRNLNPLPVKTIFRFSKYKQEQLNKYPQEERKYKILIDDRGDIIKRWEDNGGTSITFVSVDQVIQELKQLLNK